MDKLISVVIATYNASVTLKRCLDSIICQLTDECELIIIDGKSSDSTVDIINQYRRYISYTVSERDHGIYDAWNKGIVHAKGRWITFVGADDILLPNAITAYLMVLKNTTNIDSYDYICAHNEYVDNNGRMIKLVGMEPKWAYMKRYMAAAHVASLHSKHNLFDAIGLYDTDNLQICADYELLMRKKTELRYLTLPNVIARMQTGGISFSLRAIKEAYWVRKRHHSVPQWYNYILYIKDCFLFKTFKIRNLYR